MITRLQAAPPALRLGFASAAFAAFAALSQLGGWMVARMAPLSLDTSGPAPALRAAPAAPWRFAPVDPLTAQRLNAALPVAAADLTPARPFVLTGDAANRALAQTCLTQAVYYEAASESEQGQRAVAQVVLNRVRHPMFPHSVCGVVYQGAELGIGCQFSFVCDGSMNRPHVAWAWNAAEAVARQALAGQVEPTVGNATHYHADYVAPYWAPTVAKVAQIGAHIFYRWAGDLGLPAAFSSRYQAVERVPAVKAPATPELVVASAPEAGAGAAALATTPTSGAPDGRVHLVLEAEAPTRDLAARPPVLALPPAPIPSARPLGLVAATPAATTPVPAAPVVVKAAPALAAPAPAPEPTATAAVDAPQPAA